MRLTNDGTRYGAVARVLHASVVLLVTFQFLSITAFRYLEEAPQQMAWTVLDAHKTAGLLLLLVVTVRVGWRLWCPPPPPPDQLDAWDRLSSLWLERGLYALLFVMALSGLTIELTGGYTVPFLSLFHLDAVAPWLHAGPVVHGAAADAARKATTVPWLRDAMVALHVAGTFLTVALVASHVSHVARHSVGKAHPLLDRMDPWHLFHRER
ncbi:MAG: cytochrome b/b6 domain-containing protein [Candidatus Sericytochromatia bacterium]|nr:cytochrome b/b6 domain-containing protein [Candidatus Sericytochromatia bacterium]